VPASFFEGPEKKFELVVQGSVGDLRAIGDEFWSMVVSAAGAEILSVRRSAAIDAYLLSESSLFVCENHLTMITCGQTTLVEALLAVLDRVGPEHVELLFYERKNEHFPDRQPTSFFDDAERLAGVIPGAALCFGAEDTHRVLVFHSTAPYQPDRDDTTIEVLMHGIDPERAKVFQYSARQPDSLLDETGLGKLFPAFEVDEHLFSPAGYSLNAVRDHEYFTVHVTPETIGSYVSFESNCDFRDRPSALVEAVVELFLPESLDVVAFTPSPANTRIELPTYQLRRHVREEVCGYEISFFHYFLPEGGPVPARSIALRS